MTDVLSTPEPEKRIELAKAVTHAGVSHDELVLREPDAGEMEDVDHLQGVAWTIALVAKVAGVPPKAVRQVPVSKLNECSEYLASFVGAAR